MRISGRNTTVALVAAAALMGAARANADDVPINAIARGKVTIVLHVSNYAALPEDILDVAMDRVVMVYARVGANVVRVDDNGSAKRREGDEFHLTVLLLSRDMAERKISANGIKNGVLGQAHPPSGRAHIFCERIATMPGVPKHFGGPLGDVIAHEVGHLLLGVNSHSVSGLMRAKMNVGALQLQDFDKSQADAIRSLLTLTEPTAALPRP